VKQRLAFAALAMIALAAGAAVAFYLYAGLYGFNVVLKRGGSVWVAITPTDPRLTPSMRQALQVPPPSAQAGVLTWTLLRPGFEIAELPVISGGAEVDRILLARIDPQAFRFEIFSRPAGDFELGDWMTRLGAALVVNGSYFSRYGAPETPTIIAGKPLGPASYSARHGAFIISSMRTGVADLGSQDWRVVFKGMDYGSVSYPLLVGPGPSRVGGDPRWLANRSFIGEDSAGRIVIGTTREAFFSLGRFADFLRQAPLGLVLALNLDGGPVACQAVRAGTGARDFCGAWETKFENQQFQLLQPLIGRRRWGLPLVIAAFPR
jgi:hypothetical protein